MIFVFYALALVTMLVIRPILNAVLKNKKSGTSAIYAAMYFFPILAFAHAALAGLLCK